MKRFVKWGLLGTACGWAAAAGAQLELVTNLEPSSIFSGTSAIPVGFYNPAGRSFHGPIQTREGVSPGKQGYEYLDGATNCGMDGEMARKIRIEYPEAVYQVMARGNQGQAIFADDQDRQRFLATLVEGFRP